MKKVIFFLQCLLIISVSGSMSLYAQSISLLKNKIRNSSEHLRGLPYSSVSAGAGVWYKSNQMGMTNRAIPYSVMLEYGRTSFPVSIIAGTFFHTTFSIDQFLINPNNFLAGLQYAPMEGSGVPRKLHLYLVGGVNICYSRFTEEIYPGIISYENKLERKTGTGLGAGIGMGYRFKSFEIKPMLFYFTGHAGFLAGHFTEQKYSTGSFQLHFTLSRRFIFNKNNRTCPVYYKYHRL